MSRLSPRRAVLLASALVATACGDDGFDNSFDIPSTITTDRSTSFELGRVFIDARNADTAFLVIRKVTGGVVGDPVVGGTIPVGKNDPLKITLGDDDKLSPGLQQFQATVYLDDADAPNGELDASDPIARAGGVDMQKTFAVEYTSTLNSFVDFAAQVDTDNPRQFQLGSLRINGEDTGARGVIVAAYADDGGSPGELLATRAVEIDQERSILISMESPKRLVGGVQTVHAVVYFEDPSDGELDDGDEVGALNGEPLEYEVSVNLTDDTYNPDITLETSLSITTPFEFEVGEYTLPTELGTRFWAVTRLVEDGVPATVLGVNELMVSFDERTLKVSLDHQLMVRDQRIHVGVYPNRTGLAWTTDTFDTTVEPMTNDQGKRFEGEIDVEFISTVVDPDAEYYAYTCGDDLNRHTTLEYKTNLKVDCRCAPNRVMQPTYELCNADAAGANGYTLGDGPRFEPLQAHMTSGDIFPERGEIIFGMDRGGLPRRKFTIVALNYETNTRRFVSGEVKDEFTGEFTVGDGPLGGEVSYVRRGPDGEMFVNTSHDGGQIFLVDPDTGDRQLLWQHDDDGYGQCPNGVPLIGDDDRLISDSQPAPYQLGLEYRGFTIDPRDGGFYLGTTNNGVPGPGYGLVKVSSDGATCTVVSTSQAEERNDYYGGVGQGYEIKAPIKSMLWHEGKLLAISGSDLLEIDPDTGDRVRLVGGDIAGSSGVPAVYRMFWNEELQLLMLTGVLPPNAPNVVAVDLETRKVWGFLCLNAEEDSPVVACMRGPQETLYIAYWPSYLLPDGTFLGGIFKYGFTRYELREGNSYLYNY